MVADAPIWSTWTDRLPNRPLAADVLADGVYRRPREQALHYAHIEFNTRGRLSWLVFDQDTDESFECWERANLPAPNFYSQNRSNGHGHLGYCLNTPIGMLGLSRERPIMLAADVQRGMTRRLGADPAYANRLAKNPTSKRWLTSWYAPKPYDLRDLLGALDRRDLRRPATRTEVSGISRNCDLFDALRAYAYANARAFKRTGRRSEAWQHQLFREAQAINLGFASPLSFAEVRQIARSVARWTWGRFSEARFSEIQSRRGVRGGIKSGAHRSQRAEAAADVVLALIVDPSASA
jgi:Replicase family/Primase C terminal 1 (PriCT-1)